MFCLAVTMLLRRADKSALVFSATVYKGVKVKAVAGPTEYRLVGSRWKLESRELFASLTEWFLDSSVWTLLSSQAWVLYPKGDRS